MELKGETKFAQSTRKFLAVYFLLAYFFAWAFFIPAALESQKLIELSFSPKIFLLIGIFAPFVSAALLTWHKEGGAGVGRLIQSGFNWRIPFQINLFIIFAPILTALIAFLVVGGKTPKIELPSLIGTFLFTSFWAARSAKNSAGAGLHWQRSWNARVFHRRR